VVVVVMVMVVVVVTTSPTPQHQQQQQQQQTNRFLSLVCDTKKKKDVLPVFGVFHYISLGFLFFGRKCMNNFFSLDFFSM
jgi:fucose permease